MKKYHKIQTLFKRDQYKRIQLTHYTIPEFEYLQNSRWSFAEKLNGQNTRIMCENGNVSYGGKTDNAELHCGVIHTLVDIIQRISPQLISMTHKDPVCIYGEGCGPGVNKGSGIYSKKYSFVVIDIKIGKWWLSRTNVLDISDRLGLVVAPIITTGSLYDMVNIVSQGLISKFSSFNAEGLVGRPEIELCTRGGERIITKLKTSDFKYLQG